MEPINIIFGPWRPDAGNMESGFSRAARNVVPVLGGGFTSILPAEQYSTSTSLTASTHTVCGGFSSENRDETEDFIGTITHLFRVSSGNAAIRDASRTTGGAYNTNKTASTDAFWDFCQFGDFTIAVNGAHASLADDPQVFQSLVSSNFAALAGSPPRAQTVASISEFVVMGNTFDSTDGVRPTRVWWSAFADHTSWTPNPATQAGFQDLVTGAGPIVRIVSGGDFGFVICERSVFVMEYEGPPTVFRFRELKGVGCQAPLTVVLIGESVYFYSTHGFVKVNRDRSWEPIGAGKIDKTAAHQNAIRTYGFVGAEDKYNQGVTWLYDRDGTAGDCYFYHLPSKEWSEDATKTGAQFIWSSRLATLKNIFGTTVDESQQSTVYWVDVERNGATSFGDGHVYANTNIGECAAISLTSSYEQLYPGHKTFVREVQPI